MLCLNDHQGMEALRNVSDLFSTYQPTKAVTKLSLLFLPDKTKQRLALMEEKDGARIRI